MTTKQELIEQRYQVTCQKLEAFRKGQYSAEYNQLHTQWHELTLAIDTFVEVSEDVAQLLTPSPNQPVLSFTKLCDNLCNVSVNQQESNWYVEKKGTWYQIQWGNLENLMSFRSQSWFSSQCKEEIKEKLIESVRDRVEIRTDRYGLKYVYQGNF